MAIQPEVHTAKFSVRRELWHVTDWVLPAPVPLVPATVAAGILFAEFKFGIAALWSSILPFPLSLAPVIGLAYLGWRLADKPSVEGKPLHVYLASQIRYYLREPKKYVGLTSAHEPSRARVHLGATWSRKG